MLPCVLGSGLLYGLGRTANYQGGLLFGYYCIAFLFGCNPLIFSWLAANTGGELGRGRKPCSNVERS
jgi:hypothetical protein